MLKVFSTLLINKLAPIVWQTPLSNLLLTNGGLKLIKKLIKS
ncbi:hypothetical protein OENI_20237 [Oenococcus oeni]|nr:hypothetical protein OENI_20237 [Oenococcus oeni]